MKQIKLYNHSLLSHLNFIGMILFSIFSMLFSLFYLNLVPNSKINIFVFFSLFSIATANVNRISFPYGKQKPALLFTSKILLLRHLYFLIVKSYKSQLLLFLLLLLILIIKIGISIIFLVTILSILSYYLSFIAYGFLNILIRILFLLQLILLLSSHIYLVIATLAVQFLAIYLVLSLSSKFDSNFLINTLSNNKTKTKNILFLILSYFKNNIFLFILTGIVVTIIFYIAQLLFSKMESLPALSIIFINWIVICEILIGQNKEEIIFDKSRIETFLSSSIVKSSKRFKNSTIFVITALIIFLCSFGIIGSLLYHFSISALLKNIIAFPLVIFTSLVYYKKSELLIEGNSSRILKFSLIIMLLLTITLYTIIS